MGKKDSRVDAYIAKAADFAKPILEEIRARVHAACPDVEETMKWSVPAFEYKGPFCGMAAFKKHCAFGFWKSALVLGEGGPDDNPMGFREKPRPRPRQRGTGGSPRRSNGWPRASRATGNTCKRMSAGEPENMDRRMRRLPLDLGQSAFILHRLTGSQVHRVVSGLEPRPQIHPEHPPRAP